MQKVNWLCTSRGGYGYSHNVAAIVLSSTEKRTRIAVWNFRKQCVEYKSVPPENLTPREKQVLPLDEIMIGEELC